MPFAIYVVARLVRACYSTGRLLVNVKLLRQLPWEYIRGLARNNPRTRFVTAFLGLSTICVLGGATVTPVLLAGICIAIVGLLLGTRLRPTKNN